MAITTNARPLVSFVLLAYNQERYIREAVEGAFSQTYSPLEIILSDDCSKDRTFEVMKAMAAGYRGPHQVLLNRNSQNLGLGRHYSKAMTLAKGQIVELAAGDDISLPWRTDDSVALLQSDPTLACVSLGILHFETCPPTTSISRNSPGLVAKWNLRDFYRTPGFFVNAPARAFRKHTHDYFGPLTDTCPVEDGPNLLRCLLHGSAATYDSVAVLYRWNGQNMSSPEGLRKIPFSAIYADYLHSIRVAYHKGLIDSQIEQNERRWFTTQFEKASLRENFYCSKRRLRACLKVLFTKNFTLREKLELLHS